MKKTLLAVAVLGLFAGAAQAQSSVTIYGIADAGINFDNGKSAAGKNWSLASGQQSTSRIGFKGAEDLGGGLSAIFTLENGYSIDTGAAGNSFPNTATASGAGRLFGRQAWVGLKGAFGAVTMGRQYSPLYLDLLAFDPFEVNQAGNAQRVFGYGLYLIDPLSRVDNSIKYASPTVAGFNGSIAYGFGEQAGAFSNKSTAMADVGYTAGPLNVQLVYQRAFGVPLSFSATGGAPAFATDVAGFGVPGVTVAGASAPDIKTTFLGGSYDFGMVKASLAAADTKIELGTPSIKIRNYLVGVTAPVGVGSLYASWNRNSFNVSNSKTNQYGVGYSHPLSKRTNLYSSFGFTKNDSAVRLNSTLGGIDREFQAGVRHRF